MTIEKHTLFRTAFFAIGIAVTATIYDLQTAITQLALDPTVWSVALLNIGFLLKGRAI